MSESNQKSGKIPLRIDPVLHTQIAERAKTENRSINSYIARLLEKDVTKNTLETRQFVGQVVEGRQITPENGLVLVSGIYYRYLIEGNAAVNAAGQYAIIEANGNILTLREI